MSAASDTVAAPDQAAASERLRARLSRHSTLLHTGRVVRALGTALQVSGLPARIGQRCQIVDRRSGAYTLADVVGIDHGDAILVPLGGLDGVAVDSEVRVIGGGVLPADIEAQITPGALEQSNVDSAGTLVEMIEAQRAFENRVKMISTAEQLDQASSRLMSLS